MLLGLQHLIRSECINTKATSKEEKRSPIIAAYDYACSNHAKIKKYFSQDDPKGAVSHRVGMWIKCRLFIKAVQEFYKPSDTRFCKQEMHKFYSSIINEARQVNGNINKGRMEAAPTPLFKPRTPTPAAA